jgi:endoglucanase
VLLRALAGGKTFITMLAFLATAAIAHGSFGQGSDTNGVPGSLLSHLKTGVNVTRWFCYTGGDTSRFGNYLGPDDFATFKRLNVQFVRLCIAPEVIDQNGTPDATALPFIDKAIDKFQDAGIAVIWDLHDNGRLGLDKSGQDNSSFVSFWQAIAQHYKGRYERSAVFELVNEPQFNNGNAQVWYDLQRQTVRAVREVDPRRTILVSPVAWSGIDALAKMEVLPERNLIYTFHCYDPFFFTHQGAEWVGEWPKMLKSVPFPSSVESVDSILEQNDAKYRSSLMDYGRAHYDDAYLLARVSKATDWGHQHHVPMLFGEFGSYPKVSPPDSRARWFEGMRAAIDKTGVANSIWGYDDAMGLGRRVNTDGTLWRDPVTLRSFYHVQ